MDKTTVALIGIVAIVVILTEAFINKRFKRRVTEKPTQKTHDTHPITPSMLTSYNKKYIGLCHDPILPWMEVDYIAEVAISYFEANSFDDPSCGGVFGTTSAVVRDITLDGSIERTEKKICFALTKLFAENRRAILHIDVIVRKRWDLFIPHKLEQTLTDVNWNFKTKSDDSVLTSNRVSAP
jgi:hypothetical protein